MPGSQAKFDLAIWKTVAGIASGYIMSYGEVARAAGFPRHARMVSKALCRSATALPWHRVVRSDRTLAFETGSAAYIKQKELLEQEGLRVVKGKVIAPEPNEHVDLDKLLWGPPDI
jgi:methylated-DNA-protein-cysteine methyltransferase-like protein